MEIVLDRKLRSGTRKEELLIPKQDLQRCYVLSRVLKPLSPG